LRYVLRRAAIAKAAAECELRFDEGGFFRCQLQKLCGRTNPPTVRFKAGGLVFFMNPALRSLVGLAEALPATVDHLLWRGCRSCHQLTLIQGRHFVIGATGRLGREGGHRIGRRSSGPAGF
jgi:hypothetical protein